MEHDSDSDSYAVTDLVNEQTRQFRVRYPVGTVAFLIVFGILAFTSVAYFGYPGDPPLLGAVFHDPWPLFVWLCLLALVFQVSILRHPSLQGERSVLLVAYLLCIVLVSGVWYSGLLGWLVGHTALATRLFSPPLLPVLVIALSIAVLVVLSLRLPVFRPVLAWLLTLLGVIGLLAGAELSGLYMHTASRTPAGDPRLAFGHALVMFLAALASVLGGFIAVVMACAVLLPSFRVHGVTNSMQFLLLLLVLAYVYLPVFAVINSMIWLSGISFRTPFFQPSVGGWIGVVGFVVTGGRAALSAVKQLQGTEEEHYAVAV